MDGKVLINKACDLVGRNEEKLLKEIFTEAQKKNLDLSFIKDRHKNIFLLKISSFFKYLFAPRGMAYFEYDENQKEYMKNKKELKHEIKNFLENNTKDLKINEFLNIFMEKI